MECLSQYTISQTQKDCSAVMKQQKKKEGDGEAVEKREDQYENQAMIITPKGAGTAVGEIGAERRRRRRRRRGLSDLELYFQPAFDELNKLNRLLDSLIEEENNKARERKRRNDHHHQMLCLRAMEVINGRDQVTRQL
jgi:mannitol-specific phosphotransferase system IIBC component